MPTPTLTLPLGPLPPTSKRRSFRPSSFRPLSNTSSTPSLSALDSSLRASLMSVGMRVRKSVPEGYKTQHKTPFSIYEQTVAAYPELQPFSDRGRGVEFERSAGESGAENGMMTDAQLEDTVDSVLEGLNEDLWGWQEGSGTSSANSSQQSNATTSSATDLSSQGYRTSGRRKRSARDDDDEDLFSPLLTFMDRDVPLRPIAQPRSRRPAAARRTSSGKGGKSVRFAGVEMEEDGDFGEADFLMPDRG